MNKAADMDIFEDVSDAFLIKEAIIDELGQDFFDLLCRQLGGRDILIPRHPENITENSRIAQAIGLENAKLLSAATGYGHYYVPLPEKQDSTTRVLDLIETHKLTNSEIAQRMGIATRSVRRILAKSGVRNPNQKPHPDHCRSAQNSADCRISERLSARSMAAERS